MKTILVTGATGHQGGAVVDHLLELQASAGGENCLKRFIIHGLTRNTSSPQAQKLASRGVTLVQGDLSDSSSVKRALEGVDAAYLVTDNKALGGVEKEVEVGTAFVRAARENGVRHVVFSSAEGANRGSGVAHFDSKYAIERELTASGLGWTILRPVAFMENFAGERGWAQAAMLGLFDKGVKGRKMQVVSVRDIGWFAAEALCISVEFEGREVALAGDYLTADEMVAAFEKVQGGKGDGGSAWKLWVPKVAICMLPEDYKKIFEFFKKDGAYTADIEKLRARHPGMWKFEDWVRETTVRKDTKE